MNVKLLLLPLAAASILAVAACDQPQQPATPAATTTETPATETPATETTAPETNAMTPVVPADAAAAAAAAVAAMTPEQKQEAVALARKTAEDAARGQNLGDDVIKQAGDAAEAAARQAMGL